MEEGMWHKCIAQTGEKLLLDHSKTRDIVEFWIIKNQAENKLSVVEMRILCWIYGKTIYDMIKNDNIRETVVVAHIVEKLVENRIRSFEHVERKFVDYMVRRVDQIERSKTTKNKKRPKKVIKEDIKKDLDFNILIMIMVIDRTLGWKLIHVADST